MMCKLFGLPAALLLLLAALTDTRKFHSKNAHIRDVIASCERNASISTLTATEKNKFTVILDCILNTVDEARQNRWNAGASILAFVPTIVAVMSNSIDDLVFISEQNKVLAIILSLCTFTVFPPRFGGERSPRQPTAAIKEDLLRCIDQVHERSNPAKNKQQPQWLYRVVLAVVITLLVAASALIWQPAISIRKEATVVFSCRFQDHVPICESG